MCRVLADRCSQIEDECGESMFKGTCVRPAVEAQMQTVSSSEIMNFVPWCSGTMADIWVVVSVQFQKGLLRGYVGW